MADSAIAYNVIGDNDVRVTPLFMASLFSSIAANGDAPNPLLLETDEPSVWLEDVISEDSAAFLRTALQETQPHCEFNRPQPPQFRRQDRDPSGNGW
ncbi:MAG: hypothetical protein H6512_14045 [Acidimicrobiia bacterium]|nr:hypothetical protein [Acidimicrobiia bacterium]